MIEANKEFQEMLSKNVWHDRSEIDRFVELIKRLSAPKKWTKDGDYVPGENYWTWARNHECKYINLRFDMRDGGFVLRNDRERISPEQLEWQYKYEDDATLSGTAAQGKG